MSNYSPYPVSFVKGEGAFLTDTEGHRYLDALSGIAVCGLGHAHPAISQALADQSKTLIHTSNLYQIPLQQQLADRLTEKSGMRKVFFCNSGAEANEAAIKIARLHGHARNIEEPSIVVMENSFHGRTMATLTATGNEKVKTGFAPLLPGFIRIPYNDLSALQALLQSDSVGSICAVMLEPILGEGGIVIPDNGYLAAIRSLCDDNDWLMLLDEVQTGMCRTGRWFAFQHEEIRPDVMTLAKALGNGVPVGACLADADAAELMQPGSHGSTFGGNPLAARAALAVMEQLDQMDACKQAAEMGEYLLSQLVQALAECDAVKSIRGKGLMIGIQLDRDCAELVQMALERNLLINVTAGNVIRLLPPLIIKKDECDQIVHTLSEIVMTYTQETVQ